MLKLLKSDNNKNIYDSLEKNWYIKINFAIVKEFNQTVIADPDLCYGKFF